MSITDINWSKNQRDIITANDRRILVSASAGSGKTTVMIARILRLILEGKRPENMVICTFTRAAAADMRTKLYRELSDFYCSSKCDKEKSAYVRRALKELSRADISTIDSFCQRLVVKYFYLIGVDPQFEVLDGGESFIMKARAVESAISQLKGEAFIRLRTILRNKHSDETLSEAIMAIIDYDSINLSPVKYDYSKEQTAREIDDLFSQLEQRIKESVTILFGKAYEPEKFKEINDYLSTGQKKFSRGYNSEVIKTGVEYLKERIEKFHSLKAQAGDLRPQSESEELINALLEAASLAKRLYAEEKQRHSLVDFADLERYALEILTIGGKEVRSKYDYVFVDEYQDINPLQERIISEVSLDANLFMVGDVKQSIYAFRGCEPKFFKEKYENFGKNIGGRAFDLDVNYRSGKNIIDFVNSVFSPVMKRDFGGTDYIKNPMIASREKEGCATLHIIKGSIKNENPQGVYSVKNHNTSKMSVKSAEAIAIANRVKELIEGGAEFGDIAILSRKLKEPLKQLAALLKDMNVPVTIGESAYYLDRPETGQLIAFLQLIDSHCDDRALAISMLSPLGGFNENELAKIRLGQSGPFYKCVSEAAKSDAKVRTFFDKVDRYTAMSQTVGADELCGAIVSECGYFNYAFSLSESAAEVLDKFLEFLGGLPCKSSLYGTLRYIEERNPFTELVGEENSVKIITIHGSKGLEFGHVLVEGLNGFNSDDLNLPISISDQAIMNVFDDRAQFLSDRMFLYRMKHKRITCEEELRILYVALTRAKETLDVFITMPKNDKLSEIYETLGAEIIDFSAVSAPSRWLVAKMQSAKFYDIAQISAVEAEPYKVLFGKANEELEIELKRYFEFAAPPAAPAKSYVSRLAHDDDEPSNIIFSEGGDGNARERGNAYHRSLEKIDFLSPDLRQIDPADLALIDESKLLAAARNMSKFGGKIFKEKPFMIRLEAQSLGYETDGYVLVQGVIDLLIIDGDEATIVDYKTGASHGGFEKGYFKQVNLYALAVERLLHKRIKAKYLYYIDEGIFVEV